MCAAQEELSFLPPPPPRQPPPDHAKEKETARGRVLDLLGDLQWHASVELAKAGGRRYGGRIHELRRLGFNVENRVLAPQDGKEFRLVSFDPGPVQEKRVRVYLDAIDARHIADTGLASNAARQAVTGALAVFDANKEKL